MKGPPMASEFKQMKVANLVLDGQEATFPGVPQAALPANDLSAVIYYEPADDTETRVTSFGNGEDIPVDATHLASMGDGVAVRHLYVL